MYNWKTNYDWNVTLNLKDWLDGIWRQIWSLKIVLGIWMQALKMYDCCSCSMKHIVAPVRAFLCLKQLRLANFALEFFMGQEWFKRWLPCNEKDQPFIQEINRGQKLTACKMYVAWHQLWKEHLNSIILPTGEGRLEIRCHGYWPNLPLDVCTGVHSGNCRIVPSSLVGRNDLED